MGSDFPVPRSLLPRVTVTPQEHAARKAQSELLLARAIDEYDHFRDVEHGQMDPQRWKLVGTQNNARLYRERQVGARKIPATLTPSQTGSSHSTGNEEDDDTSDFDLEALGVDTVNDVSTAGGGEFKRRLKSMRLIGELTGFMENALYAVNAKTTEELSLIHVFLHEQVADNELLYTMEGPTPERPFDFLGYHWFVKKAPGGGRLIRHRDTVYLERLGITKNRRGEDIGYMLIESVDLPGFPEMPERNCLRSLQSVQFLVRQKSVHTVELFMTSVVEPAGRMFKPLTTMLTSDTIFASARVMELAELRRLSKMIVIHRHARERLMMNHRERATACSLCFQRSRFFSTSGLLDCSICGNLVCSRCRTHKHVYVSDHELGRLQRIDCCKTCLLQASRARPPQRTNSSQGDSQQRPESASAARARASSDTSVVDGIPIQSTLQYDGKLYAREGVSILTPQTPVMLLNPGNSRGISPFDQRPGESGMMDALPVSRGQPQVEPSFTLSEGSRGAYDLRHVDDVDHSPHSSTTDSGPRQPHTDLYLRMLELRRVAEDTYQTTRHNHLYMEQVQQGTAASRKPPARHLY